MIAGHTKFAPDRLFAILANNFYSSDVFNEKQLVDVYRQHSDVTFDNGGIVRLWRETNWKVQEFTRNPIIPWFLYDQESRNNCYNESSQ